MKQLISSILSLFTLSVASGSDSSLWERANSAYIDGDFASASALYDSIERSGMVSARLYYNKAGSLFKQGKIGPAILYYSKAERLAPSDGDISHNLAVASSYTRNRIEPLPEFFLKTWGIKIASIMSGNAWAWSFIFLITCALAGALLYLLPLRRRLRKIGFVVGLAAVILAIFALSFAHSDWRESTHPTGGIVMVASASVKSSPDSAGTDLFLLSEGDRVTVLDTMNEWNEISIANGSRGWIRSSALSMID